MFEHEQLLAQHKEACVMGWRRRSGNLIALRAEEAREERRQTSAAGLPAPGQAWAGPNTHTHTHTHTQGLQRKEIYRFMAAAQDQT